MKYLILKKIVKKYSLLFLIAITFLICAGIYLAIQEKEFGVKLIAEKTTQLSIMMLGIAFVFLLLETLVLNLDSQKTNNQMTDFAGVLTRLLIGSFGASTIPTAFKVRNI